MTVLIPKFKYIYILFSFYLFSGFSTLVSKKYTWSVVTSISNVLTDCTTFF